MNKIRPVIIEFLTVEDCEKGNCSIFKDVYLFRRVYLKYGGHVEEERINATELLKCHQSQDYEEWFTDAFGREVLPAPAPLTATNDLVIGCHQGLVLWHYVVLWPCGVRVECKLLRK